MRIPSKYCAMLFTLVKISYSYRSMFLTAVLKAAKLSGAWISSVGSSMTSPPAPSICSTRPKAWAPARVTTILLPAKGFSVPGSLEFLSFRSTDWLTTSLCAEQLGSALFQQFFGETPPQLRRRIGMAADLTATEPAAVGAGNYRGKLDFAAGQPSAGADRHITVAAETFEQSALGGNFRASGRIVEKS